MVMTGVREGLPLRSGIQAQMNSVAAKVMGTLSTELRTKGFVSIPGVPGSPLRGTKPQSSPTDKAGIFREWCDQNSIEKFSGALPTLLQMLQIEDQPLRLLLVRELAKVKNKDTTMVLALRAIFDLSPEVREAAVAALQERNPQHYLPVFLQGLRYPWVPVADKAAVALCLLKPKGADLKLIELLDKPDPLAPFPHPKTKKPVVMELVRLNHMRNCVLCHAPSVDQKDLVRGLVPTPSEPLPRLYYAGQRGNFVRADITFLHQDFSVTLRTPDAKPWPEEQRFDFVVRLRPVKPTEGLAKRPQLGDYPQREAVRYALAGITGKEVSDPSLQRRKIRGITKDADHEPPTATKSEKKRLEKTTIPEKP
jgi:hypothetical protein